MVHAVHDPYKIVCGANSSYALTADSLYSWGLNDQCQLGFPSPDRLYQPKKMQTPYGQRVVDVSAGDSHFGLVTNTGAVFTCGSNSKG